jgi:uncharacterized protein (DUF362 family)/Pyruvate/2-oxoacid:ferredoxin oxidoreductase delta subunit
MRGRPLPATVHLAACPTYDPAAVSAAVAECLEAAASADLIRPGARVLLKPNVINSMPPERAVCTHPEVVRAAAEWVLGKGGLVTVGDQPGYALTDDVEPCFRNTGMIAACRDLPVEFRLLAKSGYESVPLAQHHRLPEIQFARDVLDADVVINLPKAKTHSQTLFTGAVKNMFGAVAPRQRLEIHLLGRYWALSEAIADCYSARVPNLHLMDAVVGMEGMGPTQGTPVELGFLAVSTDGVALDALTQDLLGFRPDQVATTVAAASLGLGEAGLRRIAVTGAGPAQLRCPIRQAPVSWGGLPAPLIRAFGSLVKARPKVHRELCRACGACAGICPREAIVVGNHAVISYERCVECFCCLEACPYDAIGVKRSALYQAVWTIKRRIDRRATSRR